MKTEKYFNELKENFEKYLTYYHPESITPYRIIGEELLKYCKVRKGRIEFYKFEGEYSDFIGYSIKPNRIYLNPNYFPKLRKWAVFLNVVVHEIAHLKGIDHTETGIMSPTIGL